MADLTDHDHIWNDDIIRAKFVCECGAEVSHQMACQFAEASGQEVTPQVLNQLCKATAIVAI